VIDTTLRGEPELHRFKVTSREGQGWLRISRTGFRGKCAGSWSEFEEDVHCRIRMCCRKIACRSWIRGKHCNVILACAAHVDLNPIRAALATTIEGSDFTSAQKRLHELRRSHSRKSSSGSSDGEEAVAVAACGSARQLTPVDVKERSGETGPCVHKRGQGCSNKGFLPMSTAG